MENLLEQYARVVGNDVINHLRQLAHPLRGMNILHINSTKEGGGVAEILNRLIPLKRELGINAEWEIITGEREFYQCTKKMHNSLQGDRDEISSSLLTTYENTNRNNYERLWKNSRMRMSYSFTIPSPLPCCSSQPAARANGYGDATSM
jgi:trehalose synthase